MDSLDFQQLCSSSTNMVKTGTPVSLIDPAFTNTLSYLCQISVASPIGSSNRLPVIVKMCLGLAINNSYKSDEVLELQCKRSLRNGKIAPPKSLAVCNVTRCNRHKAISVQMENTILPRSRKIHPNQTPQVVIQIVSPDS